MLGISNIGDGKGQYRVFVCNMIARERAELGLSVVEKLRPWIKTKEVTIAAASETDAWDKAFDLYPPTEGYFIEAIKPMPKAS